MRTTGQGRKIWRGTAQGQVNFCTLIGGCVGRLTPGGHALQLPGEKGKKRISERDPWERVERGYPELREEKGGRGNRTKGEERCGADSENNKDNLE
ncbi:hypothetical protein BDV38DRAFT_250768 [Aspergillus pseudotamarii]|uniref:Uncharacterized protein n=1 Tax=Aspergillus pseudotamarii TaxID=132259 RepID=A0A5N6SS28_ASPPS|nr:uncharacterized protein BDV38DRAFT_250768 [Aspergillus pseudotamarii]KAE8135944.1 hypothetical protein BDV38DRAFT_250768 [Aspergillus pseudotamarii]